VNALPQWLLQRPNPQASRSCYNRAKNELSFGSPNIKPSETFYFGSRFHSAHQVATRAASHLPAGADEWTKDNYIMASYMDSASADHYYTYEKDWGE
jgi:hypothetical protein